VSIRYPNPLEPNGIQVVRGSNPRVPTSKIKELGYMAWLLCGFGDLFGTVGKRRWRPAIIESRR